MALRAAIILPLGGFAIYYLLDFFTGGGTALVQDAQPNNASAPMQAGVYQPGAPVLGDATRATAPGKAVTPMDLEIAEKVARKKKLEAMSPGQRYVWQMSEVARIRLAARMGAGQGTNGLLEWVNSSQTITERLTIKQVRDLGITVELHDFGAMLSAAGEVVIATAWPLNVPLRDERHQLYSTNQGKADGAGPSASEALASAANTGAAGQPGVIPYSGKLPGRGFTGSGD
jgi:RNA-splicing ligase RtcB